nr:DUF1707 domain-containing protein [Corynebacterium lactis]
MNETSHGADGTDSTNGPKPPEIRIGDTDRHKAMERLGNFFADGYLDIDEFDERTEAAAVARSQAELDRLFADLPSESGGTGALAEPEPGTPGSQHAADAPAELQQVSAESELQALLEKGKRLKIFDGFAFTIGLITIGLLVFTEFEYAWTGFMVAMAVALGGRAVLGISDDEEEILEEISDSESKRRTERLRIAAEKRRQIEQRKDLS